MREVGRHGPSNTPRCRTIGIGPSQRQLTCPRQERLAEACSEQQFTITAKVEPGDTLVVEPSKKLGVALGRLAKDAAPHHRVPTVD